MSRLILRGILLLCAAAPWQAISAQGDAQRGREISIRLCARCHVVGDHNPMGGIGSTPSFQAMTFLSDYIERMQTFYARRPHPAFVQVPGQQAAAGGQSYGPELTVTPAEIADIVAFVEQIAAQRSP